MIPPPPPHPSANVSFHPPTSCPPRSCPGTAPARSPSLSAAEGPPGRQPRTAQTPSLDAPRVLRPCSPTALYPQRADHRLRAPRSICSLMLTAAWTARPRRGRALSKAPPAPWAVLPPRDRGQARSASKVPLRPSTIWDVRAPRVAALWRKGPRPSSPSAGPRRAHLQQPTTRPRPSGAPCWARAAAPSPRLCARKVRQGPQMGGDGDWGPVPRHILMRNHPPQMT